MAADISAANDAQLRAAIRNAKPGDKIRLGAGPFNQPVYAQNIAGTADKPIVIAGASAEKPAVFDCGGTVMQMQNVAHIHVENIYIKRAGGHGLAFDDGGKNDWSCHHITISHCRIDDVGPKGTLCSIKMAGVSDFSISDCTFEKWATGGGCAVDGVGCKEGVVERCRFLAGRGDVGVQFKGGSEKVVIRQCEFHEIAGPAIHAGGSTGRQFFRPKLQGFEARDMTIERNLFIGADAPVSFATADGITVRFNTIYLPKKWAFRILQESNGPEFTPCRNGRIENNIIVFKSNWFEGGVNVGANTEPDSFKFTANAWYCIDNPARSMPRLPTPETFGVVGKDPRFIAPDKGDFHLAKDSALKDRGRDAVEATR